MSVFAAPQKLYRKPQRLFGLFVAMLLCTSGCVKNPAVITSQPLAGASSSDPTERWEEDIRLQTAPHQGTLTLDQAIQEALAKSPELQQVEQRIDAADAQIKQAEALFYPRIAFSERYDVTDNPVYALMSIINQRRLKPNVNFNDPGRQQNFATTMGGEWSLFEGGRRWFDRNAAISHKHSLKAEWFAARNRLISKVTETYYRWLQALAFIDVADRALQAARQDEELGEARLHAEVALESEVLRLKARTAEMQSHLVSAQTAVRRLQAGLERLMARPISAEETPHVPFPSNFSINLSAPEDNEQLIKQALHSRPEMAAVRSLIEAARHRVRSAQGGLFPRLGTTIQYQLDSEDLKSSSDSWMLGIQATWALFEGGLTLSRISEAKARLKEIEARGQQVALDIALEVHQAALAVQEAAERIKVAEDRKEWARKALDEVRYSYRNEIVTVDSLLQAEVAWNKAEVEYTSALFDGRIAQALLRQALGDFAQWTE